MPSRLSTPYFRAVLFNSISPTPPPSHSRDVLGAHAYGLEGR
jgi:hypothetical protein